MTKIKICGLTRVTDIDIVNQAKPDYIGFVFAKSRRQVPEEVAFELKQKLSPSIQAVGVFVNEDVQKIIRLCQSGTIDIIQLHGEENDEVISELRATLPNPIIKAIRVRGEEDIVMASKLTCDYLLFDAYKEDQYGGSGETFDWSVITKLDKPFFLAGGIHVGNVESAIERTNPYCIDVSSGVEKDGWKDQDKVFDIISRVRNR